MKVEIRGIFSHALNHLRNSTYNETILNLLEILDGLFVFVF